MNKLTTGCLVVAVTAAVAAPPTIAAAAGSPADGPQRHPGPAAAARTFVDSHPRVLQRADRDRLIQQRVLRGGRGLSYVSYRRTFAGLPVIGGDAVVVTGASGRVLSTSVAQDDPVRLASTTATVAPDRAAQASRARLTRVGDEGTPRLAVLQRAHGSRLVWETTVTGRRRDKASRQDVYVDAHSGKVVGSKEHVVYGDGTSAYNGPNPVHLDTTASGGRYYLQDPGSPSLQCQDAATNTTFSGTDDAWGNGDPTSRETGCVDALFGAEKEKSMLSSWLGRNGMDGNGGWVPVRVGLNDVNAYYDGRQVQVGHSQTGGRWIGAIDVVAHELGHGVDDHTPGGISGGNTQEFVADTFGAMTESYAAEPAPYDTPDYTVGEQVNLTGSGPIRYMYDPSKAGDDNCYSALTPTEEVHAAAGPGNHWFYLLAEGSSPSDGQPASPTCNGSSVSGLGIQKAAKIMYNAMLMKTSLSGYGQYRTWTLTAAKNLYGASGCAEFNAVKAAWDAVSVPAQLGDPTCTTGGTTPSPSPTPTPTGGGSQLLSNLGFESGRTGWTGTAGPITDDPGRPARTGSWKAWLGGNGRTATESEQQTVTIPSSASAAALSYWIRTDTAERTSSRAYDTMKVQVISGGTTRTLRTYSNLGTDATYQKASFDLSSYKGQQVTVRFLMNEDYSRQTSFVVDDTALDVS